MSTIGQGALGVNSPFHNSWFPAKGEDVRVVELHDVAALLVKVIRLRTEKQNEMQKTK